MKVKNNGLVNILLTNTPYTVLAPGCEADIDNYDDFIGLLDLVAAEKPKNAKPAK